MDPLTIIIIISILGPIIGSAIGVVHKPTDTQLSVMLSFAAGVMLSISFLQLIPHSIELSSIGACVFGVSLGSLLIYILDKMIPHIHPELCGQEHGRQVKRSAVFLSMGIFLHNFPEGMAIAIGTVSGIKDSLTVAVAIAIQKVPEGICTSSPYYHATGRKLKSFLLSCSTAIPILIGFIFARILYQTISNNFIGIIIAATAGLMIYISADELIPMSCSIKAHHGTIFSFMVGVMLVILLGLI